MTEDNTMLISISKVEYDISVCPAADSSIVAEARRDVLQNLDLNRIILNLERTNELLFVTACSVAGAKNTTLSGKIAHLQFKLIEACSDASLSMLDLKDSSQNMVGVLLKSFKYLYANPPREDKTLKILVRCGKYAEEMAKTAENLADTFKTLAYSSEEALENVLTERDMEEQVRQQAIKRKQELTALEANKKTLSGELVHQIEEMQTLADDARAAQAKAEDRALGLAIMSGITSAISSGVQAFAAYKSAPITAGANIVKSVTSTPKTKEETKPKKNPFETDGDTKPKKNPFATDGDSKPKKNPFKTGGASKTKKNSFEGDGKTDNQEKEKETSGANAAALSAVAAATKSASEEGENVSQSYSDISARHAAEKKEYMNKLFELKKIQREALSEIAEYAERIKNADINAANAVAAVDSLQQAVSALKQIVNVFETTKYFWQLVAKACNRLTGDDLLADIELIQDDPPEERMEEYQEGIFKESLVRLVARWYALHLIADEYQQGVMAARDEIKKTYNKAPSIEQGRQLAPKLGEKLSLQVQRDIAEIDAEIPGLSEKQENVRVAAG